MRTTENMSRSFPQEPIYGTEVDCHGLLNVSIMIPTLVLSRDIDSLERIMIV